MQLPFNWIFLFKLPSCLNRFFLYIFSCFLFSLGPAPAKITEAIYKESLAINEYLTVENLHVDLSLIGVTKFDVDGRNFEVEVINSITDYVEFMKEIFDFTELKEFLKDVKIVANGMHAGILFSICFWCKVNTLPEIYVGKNLNHF